MIPYHVRMIPSWLIMHRLKLIDTHASLWLPAFFGSSYSVFLIRQYLLTKGVPPSEAVTIYKGHDPSRYSPAPRDVLREFGIPPDAFVIICTAAMRARKGIPVLIDSLRYLPKDSVHILLVGRITDRRVLPLINLESHPFMRYMLKRRGVFTSLVERAPAGGLDDEDKREISILLKAVEDDIEAFPFGEE